VHFVGLFLSSLLKTHGPKKNKNKKSLQLLLLYYEKHAVSLAKKKPLEAV